MLAGRNGLQGPVVVYKLYLGGFLDSSCGLDKRLSFQKPAAGWPVAAGHGNGSIGRHARDLWSFWGKEICIIVELGRFLPQRAAVDSGLGQRLIGLL